MSHVKNAKRLWKTANGNCVLAKGEHNIYIIPIQIGAGLGGVLI
jgi:hypothetical protein